MIQHRLVFHYTGYEDGVTYYEANLQAAYYQVRAGKILEFIRDRLGDYAAAVMSAIMFFGHVQISHLETLPELNGELPNGVAEENGEYEEGEEGQEDREHQDDQDDQVGQEDQVNGVDDHHAGPGLHSTLKILAAHGYIMRVREAHFQSRNDTVLDAERKVKSRPDIKQLKGKKYEEAVMEGTTNLVNEQIEADLTRGLMVNGVPRGAKRKHNVVDGPNKKQRTDYAAVDEDDEENEWSDDEGDAFPMQVSRQDEYCDGS